MMKKNSKKIILISSLIFNLFIFYIAYKALGYRSHINYFLDKYTNVVNELSGRDYFVENNQKMSKKTNNGKRVVLLGTQVTENWLIPDSLSEFEFINRGLPHQRVAGFLLRFKPDVIELQPIFVIIEVSSYNFRPQNSVKEIQDYVTQMTELAIYNKIIPVLTTVIPLTSLSINDLDRYDDVGDYPVIDSLQYYNRWLRKYCINNQIGLIDFNFILSDSSGYLNPEYSIGGIDLNKAGYKLISQKTVEKLKSITY